VSAESTRISRGGCVGGRETDSGVGPAVEDGKFGRSLSVQGRQMREVPPGGGLVPPARIWRGRGVNGVEMKGLEGVRFSWLISDCELE
jgi:hypothetical protein